MAFYNRVDPRFSGPMMQQFRAQGAGGGGMSMPPAPGAGGPPPARAIDPAGIAALAKLLQGKDEEQGQVATPESIAGGVRQDILGPGQNDVMQNFMDKGQIGGQNIDISGGLLGGMGQDAPPAMPQAGMPGMPGMGQLSPELLQQVGGGMQGLFDPRLMQLIGMV